VLISGKIKIALTLTEVGAVEILTSGLENSYDQFRRSSSGRDPSGILRPICNYTVFLRLEQFDP
jgi:hypothetical protein